jgi:hypothetical protein
MGAVTRRFFNWMVDENPASVRQSPQLIDQLTEEANVGCEDCGVFFGAAPSVNEHCHFTETLPQSG